MARVRYDNVTLQYPGTDRPAVVDLDLDIADGEFLVLVGPSGCGKSTALRMIAGLEEVTDGQILIGDKDVTGVSPKDRDIAMVFQNYALYPHMSVAENMGFALKIAGVKKEERRKRVEEVAEQLDLTEYLDRKPKALSGGQRQRVAMGRAIVRKPRVFLMDEPLSNLDAKLRVQTRSNITKLQKELGITTVYVTHDQIEALTMGDRIAVLKLGQLQQVGTPRDLLDRPVNLFVAGFIGSPSMNQLECDVVDGGFEFGNMRIDMPAAAKEKLGDRAILGIRPEDLMVVRADEAGLPGHVTLVEDVGADGFLYADAQIGTETMELVARVDGRMHAEMGQNVTLQPKLEHLHVFDAERGERIFEADGQLEVQEK
jgi:multiple sugar transport system ATP-binding protein